MDATPFAEILIFNGWIRNCCFCCSIASGLLGGTPKEVGSALTGGEGEEGLKDDDDSVYEAEEQVTVVNEDTVVDDDAMDEDAAVVETALDEDEDTTVEEAATSAFFIFICSLI